MDHAEVPGGVDLENRAGDEDDLQVYDVVVTWRCPVEVAVGILYEGRMREGAGRVREVVEGGEVAVGIDPKDCAAVGAVPRVRGRDAFGRTVEIAVRGLDERGESVGVLLEAENEDRGMGGSRFHGRV